MVKAYDSLTAQKDLFGNMRCINHILSTCTKPALLGSSTGTMGDDEVNTAGVGGRSSGVPGRSGSGKNRKRASQQRPSRIGGDPVPGRSIGFGSKGKPHFLLTVDPPQQPKDVQFLVRRCKDIVTFIRGKSKIGLHLESSVKTATVSFLTHPTRYTLVSLTK